ncbi:F-box protein At-B isoform X2 [Jatropha curcas]|uniref:F-box protein At-B isoform X2 n=1 Tax=Jatropha curcas TaxID=180498 RepID=UPI0009D6A8D9|nr:F-box protein At-B isoform X2 [Jatropha curcas]
MELERLPSNLINEEILARFELETLCTVACVSKALRFSVDTQVLPFLSSLHFPESLIPDANALYHVLSRCTRRGRKTHSLKTLNLNCQRLHHSCLTLLLGKQVEQLNFFCCSLLSSQFLVSIGKNCPFIRVLTLELADGGLPHVFNRDLVDMLCRCHFLECLFIKIRGAEVDAKAFNSIECFLPKTIKLLKLKPMLEENAICLANKLGVGINFSAIEDFSVTVSPTSYGCTLQYLSLVLDVISDRLLLTIASSLPLLVELDLEDRPNKEPSPHLDLTNSGLQSLGSCHHLSSLSLIRSRQNYQSCQKLKKFEVRNALFLSDLAFHNLIGTQCALVEVRLLSCNLITSESVKKLSSSNSLEVLDLCGCKSIADSCFSSISSLQRLTSLNLTGADITDSGLSVLGQRSPPISYLSLRRCKRITDKGISLLLCGEIVRTLAALDLGYLPGISDNGIFTFVAAGKEITELSIRCCFYVTDSSLQALATKRRFQDGSKQLKQLDLFNCTGLSAEALWLLKSPSFSGLHWVGIGETRLASKGGAVITEIRKERPWLTLCIDGCEMGCRDGWHLHTLESF